MTPQDILKDYKQDKYLEENIELIFPAVKMLYEDVVSSELSVGNDLKRQVHIVKEYFTHITDLAKKNNIKLNNDPAHDGEAVARLLKLISEEDLLRACSALNGIIKFIDKYRTNINNLSYLIWILLNKTTKDGVKYYLDNDEELKQALTNQVFIVILLKYPEFGVLMLNDLLFPIEIINPSRRKGSLGDKIFKIVFGELKKKTKGVMLRDRPSLEVLANSDNWYITERVTNAIDFPRPKPNSKRRDMICKIKGLLFVCSHKEQYQGGGGQDNQAEDAGTVFEYKDEILPVIKKKFNASKIFLCVFLEGNGKVLGSSHWGGLTAKVEDKNNENKYLLNSYQFIQLVKSLI